MKRGMAVMIKGQNAKIDEIHNENLIYSSCKFRIWKYLRVWAYNLGQKKYGSKFNGETSNAIAYYSDFLKQDKTFLIAGDFNNSVIWDKKNSLKSFDSSIRELEMKGFVSSYHSKYCDAFGEESGRTFFHTKKQSLSYHIDYNFTKKQIISCNLGLFDDWVKYSDHVPLICEI